MIYFDNVSKIFAKNIIALSDITFHIQPGEFVNIVGTSGAGKTTLVNLIIKNDVPSKGKIYIGGVDLTFIQEENIPYLRRNIGVVFQDFKLFPQKTVYENVAFSLEVLGIRGREIKKVVPSVLQMVGLLERAKNFPKELSGGEIQRVAIARAIISQPKILIADEPTGNVDPQTAWEIMELLLKINKLGTTIVLATHNKEIVNALKKRVITLNKGQIIKDQKEGRYVI